MKNLWVIVIAILSLPVLSYEASLVHQHYTKWEGVLPEPYNSIELEIRLNPENDDVEFFELKIGGTPIEFKKEDLAKLKDLELGTLEFWQEMYRDPDRPSEPSEDFMQDWLYLKMELGERYRIQWEQEGKTRYHWGKDTVTIMVTMGKNGSINVSKLQQPRW